MHQPTVTPQPYILRYVLTRPDGYMFYANCQWLFDLCFDVVTKFFPKVSGRQIILEVSDEPFGDEQTGVALEFEKLDGCIVILKRDGECYHVTSGTKRMLRTYFRNDDKIFVRIT